MQNNMNVNEHKQVQEVKGKTTVRYNTKNISYITINFITVSSLFTSDFLLRCLCVITTTRLNDVRREV